VVPDPKVYGVKGLSVVDASLFPLIPGAHLSATVCAVAEKVRNLPITAHSTISYWPF